MHLPVLLDRIEGRKLPVLSFSCGEAILLGKLQMDVAHLGGEQPGSFAVAVTKPYLTGFMGIDGLY
jgi:hypothetical protein